jgi:hypothetical protein
MRLRIKVEAVLDCLKHPGNWGKHCCCCFTFFGGGTIAQTVFPNWMQHFVDRKGEGDRAIILDALLLHSFESIQLTLCQRSIASLNL